MEGDYIATLAKFGGLIIELNSEEFYTYNSFVKNMILALDKEKSMKLLVIDYRLFRFIKLSYKVDENFYRTFLSKVGDPELLILADHEEILKLDNDLLHIFLENFGNEYLSNLNI
jgi:hypothetical protein